MGVTWLNPAGGLRYHLRALSNAPRWAPFRQALGTWLERFEAPGKRAVLVGPSAAYTFPDVFLQRFSAVTLLEPDPVAGYLLKRRLHRLGVHEVKLERRDLLIAPLLAGRDGLPELLAADPGLVLVFCNVLGQTRFLLEDPEFERFKAAFRERIGPELGERAWLSIHDRWSGNLAPVLIPPLCSSARLDDQALRALYPSTGPERMVELFDHQSDGLFPDSLPHAYFSWQLDRTSCHLIEGVASNGAGHRAGGR